MIHECHPLRNRRHIFRDRVHAGEVVAEMLDSHRGSDATVLAVPAGGVPVAVTIAKALDLPLDVAVVSKITLPWNTEVGYGAVAFDGTVRINDALAASVGLSEPDIQEGLDQTAAKVQRRMKAFRGDRPPLNLNGRSAILVDDGLASGFTMRVAIEAVSNMGAASVIVAVPTAPMRTAEVIAQTVDDLFCANIRVGIGFAVADAYLTWSDIDEAQAVAMLRLKSREE